MLVATGQPLRALQVTDELAGAGDGGEGLARSRREWMDAAWALGGDDAYAIELAVRAVLTAPWGSDGFAGLRLDDFPYDEGFADAGPSGAPLDFLQHVVRGERDEAAWTVIDLVHRLVRLAHPARKDQAAFWAGPAQAMIEAVARGAFEAASDRLGASELDGLHNLLQKAGGSVMAADVRKLNRIYRAPTGAAAPWRLPAAAAPRPAARRACVLGNGNVVVWGDSQQLQLLDRHGRLLWRQPMSHVEALIAVGSSPHVIIVQSDREHGRRLTRLASHQRTLHPIGLVAMRAWHDVTSDTQWLVQIGGEVGALDLVKLCAPEPRVEFLWSCALTERLQAVAFGHDPAASIWITVDAGGGAREGLIEIWTLRNTGELVVSVGSTDAPGADWAWLPQSAVSSVRTTEGPVRWMQIRVWSEPVERAAMAELRKRDFTLTDSFQSCDLGRPYISRHLGLGEGGLATTSVAYLASKERGFVFEHDRQVALTCLARSPAWPASSSRKNAPDDRTCIFADDHGGLYILDTRTGGVVSL